MTTSPMPDTSAAATMHLLIVDDEIHILRSLQRALRQAFGQRLAVRACSSGADALEQLLARPFDVVMSDLRMPGMTGLQLLQRAAEIQPGCTRMILTATADFASAQEAVNGIGVYRYLSKPWLPQDLQNHVQAALDHAAAGRQQAEQARAWAASRGAISAQEVERVRLEAQEPGITQVQWDSEGCVLMPALDD